MAGEDDLARARHAIGTIESSNNYGITGPATGGNVPLGRYQVMSSNLPSWSQEALGRQVSPQEYLSSPGLQDQLFNHHFGKYMDKYGPEGASRAWFGGEGSVYNNSGSKDILGTSVGGYGSKFSSLFNGGAGADGPQMAQGSGGPSGSPAGRDPSTMTDAEIDAELADQSGAKDPASMTDAEIDAELGAAGTPKNYDLADVPGAALSNVGKNAGEVVDSVKNFATQAWNNPGATAGAIGNGLWGGAVGAVMPDVRAILRKASPQTLPGVEAWATRQGAGASPLDPIASPAKVGKLYEDTKRDVAEKPVEMAANLATLAAPGAGGATRGLLAAPGKVAGPLVRGGTELLSGVSSEAQKLASKAGELGGVEGGAFRSQMARPDYAGMQDTGMAAKQAARAEKSANWQSGMADATANAPDALPNPYGPAQQAAQTARADAYSGNFLKHRGVPGVMDEVDAAIAEHMADATQTGSVASMDALKQRVNGIWRDQKEGTPERRAVGQVQKALADQLNTASPEYAATMAKYGDDSDLVKNAISDLGLGERATRRSTSGKLLAALRPDSVAGTARGDSLAAMTKHEPTLPYQIAGATMNPPLPRGIVGRGSALLHAGAVGGAEAFVPALIKALPMLLAASPRAVGEARYAIGAAKRGARSVGVTQKNIGNLVDALRLISTRQNKDQ